MERNMNREVETIREKVHTTADAALFLCFQEVKGSHSKGVIMFLCAGQPLRLERLHFDANGMLSRRCFFCIPN